MSLAQRFALAVAAVVVVGAPVAASGATYNVNKSHTMASFRIRHFVSNVEGRFDGIDGVVRYDPKKPEDSSVEMTIDAKTINTANERRDADLRGSNFFDVEKCPTLSFKSSKAVARDTRHLDVTGQLTMRCVTKTVTVPVELLGVQKLREGAEKAGFESTFTVDRREFGIVWNQTLDDGGLMLGDEVKITISLEADLQKEEAPTK